ncbi:MAG TPA: hypothetical protein QGF58_21930 [Myxococcota bacterium]|nr:hypothetical protein [Myxococcota bacterium]
MLEDTALPPPTDDCTAALDNDLGQAQAILGADGTRHTGLWICEGDIDVYAIAVPPMSWLAFEVQIGGSGHNPTDKTDLDLWELDDPQSPLDDALRTTDEEDIVWYSASAQPYERLAWYNDSQEPALHYIAVDGYHKAVAAYDISVTVDDFHDDLDCDGLYEDTSESGPCNRILQFPQANSVDEGYVVSHEAHYSNLRREVAYVVRHAAAEVQLAWPDTMPLGLMDMSQTDGDTPGRDEGTLRHPEGTHVYGNDIDIAYYQTGSDNLGRAVCTNNGYFCTSDPSILDTEKTAYFMAMLLDSKKVRVIGVDPLIAEQVLDATDDLVDAGTLTSGQKNKIRNHLAYGDGWPFHHHHMHFSWDWEDGWDGHNELSTCGHTLPEPLKPDAVLGPEAL